MPFFEKDTSISNENSVQKNSSTKSPQKEKNDEQYQAHFKEGFDPKDLADTNICIGVSTWDFENHSGKKLEATLNLAATVQPESCTWFIGDELQFLNALRENNELLESQARTIAKEKGNEYLYDNGKTITDALKTKKIDSNFLRWSEIDNNNDNPLTQIFKKAFAQICFLYLMPELNFSREELHDLLQAIKAKGPKASPDGKYHTYEISGINELLIQYNFPENKKASTVYLLAKLTTLDLSIEEISTLDLMPDPDKPKAIYELAIQGNKIINDIAGKRTSNYIQELKKPDDRPKQSNKKNFNTQFTITLSRDFPLFDAAMIVALAHSKRFTCLLYPFRQQSPYLEFGDFVRKLCKPYGMKLEDILFTNVTQLKRKQCSPIGSSEYSLDNSNEMSLNINISNNIVPLSANHSGKQASTETGNSPVTAFNRTITKETTLALTQNCFLSTTKANDTQASIKTETITSYEELLLQLSKHETDRYIEALRKHFGLLCQVNPKNSVEFIAEYLKSQLELFVKEQCLPQKTEGLTSASSYNNILKNH